MRKQQQKKINEANLLEKHNNTKKFTRTIYVKNRLINYIYN